MHSALDFCSVTGTPISPSCQTNQTATFYIPIAVLDQKEGRKRRGIFLNKEMISSLLVLRLTQIAMYTLFFCAWFVEHSSFLDVGVGTTRVIIILHVLNTLSPWRTWYILTATLAFTRKMGSYLVGCWSGMHCGIVTYPSLGRCAAR